MIGRILIGAALGAGCLLSGSLAQAWEGDLNARAQDYRNPYYNQNYGGYDENRAFTQGCPRGSIPESFPGGSGRRCALPGGGYTY
jgi:hypothetical protein